MAQGASTVDVEYFRPEQASQAIPGLIVVFSGERPRFEVHAFSDGELEVGRAAPGGVTIEDRAMSRRHARVSIGAGHFDVEDLGSRNGLVVDGVTIESGRSGTGVRVMRLGQTVIVLCSDIRPMQRGALQIENGVVVGPQLRKVWSAIDSIAESGDVLHLRGESGVGKELAAERFHTGRRTGKSPFVPINCAAIPKGVAERLLFGARKGAFSGAHADAMGLIQAADNGTLFLDEVGELELDIQAKLLRALERRSVMPIGDVKAHAVDFRLVSATHQDLRKQVSDRSFREDLYYRLGRPEVILPPLRDRPEELSYLADLAVGTDGPTLSPAFIESCLLRPWPGNVRELLLEVREAARQATLEGASAVLAEHLSAPAGRPHQQEVESSSREASDRIDKTMMPEREVIEAMLRETGGKVATTARMLGVHRNQLRRWLAEHDLDPTSLL